MTFFLSFFIFFLCDISTHFTCVFIRRTCTIKNRYKNDVKMLWEEKTSHNWLWRQSKDLCRRQESIGFQKFIVTYWSSSWLRPYVHYVARSKYPGAEFPMLFLPCYRIYGLQFLGFWCPSTWILICSFLYGEEYQKPPISHPWRFLGVYKLHYTFS